MPHDLGPLPRMHDREVIVREAEDELRLAISISSGEGSKLSELTTAELLQVYNSVFSSAIGTVLKYAIRKERHGRTDRPGGITSEKE